MLDVNCSFGARISLWPFSLVLSEVKPFQSLQPDTVYWIPSLALLFQHLLPTSWQYCGLITADTRVGVVVFYSAPSHCCSLCSCFHIPTSSEWTGEQAAGLASVTNEWMHQHSLSPSPSCHYSFRPQMCHHNKLFASETCISSFLKCQAFLPFDINDCWTYIKKIPPPILFPVCSFQRVTCGSSAWQGRLSSWQ